MAKLVFLKSLLSTAAACLLVVVDLQQYLGRSSMVWYQYLLVPGTRYCTIQSYCTVHMLPFSYRAVVPAAAGTTQHDIQRAAPIITVVLVHSSY